MFPLPSAEGYIFDFNGTLFWDEEENREAWNRTAEAIRGRALDDEEFQALNGRTDRDTVLYLVPGAREAVICKWSLYKEEIYKDLCISRHLKLPPGAEEVLSILKERNAAMAIASSAPKMNMDWYVPYLSLERFFDSDRIICSPPGVSPKPSGDIFRLAMRRIGTSGKNTVIFEDSLSGVKAAEDAKASCIYRIKGRGKSLQGFPNVKEIESFMDFLV